MELSGYVFETLREDREFAMFRGRQPDNPVSILVLAPIPGRQSSTVLARLEHECAFADELDPSWAIRPLALARHDGRMTLTLEDPGGDPLDSMLGKPLELTRFLRLAIGLAAALHQVHRAGLIHKDIKPANVLVDATGRVRLMGFGIASRLSRDHQVSAAPEIIAGTLAYMAPEQTGRMNRSVDARSDLYSLGVTLYEMLTGTLPFAASDPMEWIHCHIARQPTPPSARVGNVEAPVEAIILKLLAKSAEDRYQTAAGLEADLRKCLTAWEENGRIENFPLAAHDVSHRLSIPERLYGREADVGTVIAAFDRVAAHGAAELVLVSGYSGIGKSSVVNELQKTLVPRHSLFAAGKFDQYKRDIPYATLAQAFQGLVRWILGQDDVELDRWRNALLEALGPNGQLMVKLIPELVAIIGEQPSVPDLPPQDTQNRFQMVFRRFLGVFARPEHPLVLFFDDLQWLDKASLTLIEHLVTHPDVRHLLLVGAYRDNEVGPAHPLMRTLAAVRAAGAGVQEISLVPLRPDDVERLLADVLHLDQASVRPLAELVFEKTNGNPFFTIQFMTALAEESLLVFETGTAGWTWDLQRIRGKGFTDNVADLMAAKLSRLPFATQETLKQLACLGNAADIATLVLVHGNSEQATQTALWQAIQAGLVFRTDDTYAFVHDRVQEAAYALVAEDERAAAHLRIGRLLASRTAPENLEENIFDIVNHLDRGAELIVAQEEREQVAGFNLMAGRRAKAATAYGSAVQYLTAGRALLGERAWEACYRLAFDLELNWAECECLTGEMASAEARLSALADHAQTIGDSAAVTRLRISLYTNLDRNACALEIGREFLRRVDIELPPNPTDEEAQQELARMWRLLAGRPIEQVLELPLMSDPDRLVAMDVLAEMLPPARFTDARLHDLMLLRMTNLSLEHGNCDASCHAYAVLNIALGFRLGDFQAGYRFSRVGCDLVDRRGLDRFKARVYMGFGCMGVPWAKHLRTGRDHIRRALDAANAAGDQTYAVYSFKNIVANLLVCGERLEDVQREAEQALAFTRKARFGLYVDVFREQLMLIRKLRGLAPNGPGPDETDQDERGFEQHLDEGGTRLGLPASWYWIHKMQACFLARDLAGSIEAAAKAESLLWATWSHLEIIDFHFYGALTRAAACSLASPDERRQHFEALLGHYEQIEVWARNCPENFENRLAMVGAEIARLEGRELDAERLYEQAIRSARTHGFVQNEGLGLELAANFYAARGFDMISDAYLRNARSCYLRWGADGKVRWMDRAYPHLAQEPVPQRPSSLTDASAVYLDTATIIKMSQAISGEIDLEKLINTLLVLAVEHAGAERCLLILAHGEEMRIEAEATTGSDAVTVSFRQASATSAELPESLLRYVVRSRDTVILDDAMAPNQFSGDEYIAKVNARSILCLPLIKQSQLVGILYLENKLSPYAFTPNKISILQIIASKAAISLENTRLYTDLRQAEEKARQSERGLQLYVDTIPALAWSAWPNGLVEFLNKQWYDFTGLSSGAGPLEGWKASFHPDDVGHVVSKWLEVLASGETGEIEARMRRFDGIYRHFLVRATPLRDDAGIIVKWYGTNTDIDDLKKAEALLAEEKRLLEMIATGHSLPAILDALCRIVEDLAGGSLASILLLDEDGKHLRHGAAPSLPASYTGAIDGKPIGPSAGSCGTAAFRKEKVFSNDISADSLWVDYRDFALSHDLRACWSIPILSSGGSVLGTFAIYWRQSREITPKENEIAEQFTHLASIVIERKLAEEALRKSERFLAHGQKISKTGSWAWNISTNKMLLSEENCRIFGFTSDQLVSDYAFAQQSVHPQDRPGLQEAVESAVRARKDFSCEFRIVLPDGSIKHVHSRGGHTINEYSGADEYIGTVMDISDRKRDEDEMRKLASLIENSTDFIGYSRSMEQVSFLNAGGRRLVGLELDEDISRYRMSDFRPAEDHQHFMDDVLPALSRDGHWVGERTLRHFKTNAVIPVLQTIFFITEKGTGRRTGIATICRDITDRKRINQNLQASLDEKDALLKEVHHRVKNNLQLISSLLNLQAARIVDPVVAEQFAESRNRVRSMALVHENLYRAGNFARVPMRAHVQNLCAHLIRAYGLHGQRVELTTRIDDVELDLDRAISTGLIINELVSNALKHAFPDGRPGHIRVDLKLVDREHCVLAVKDDGVGVRADFDAERADSLGLQLVHDLTRQLHGVISLEREGGSSFSINFAMNGLSERTR